MAKDSPQTTSNLIPTLNSHIKHIAELFSETHLRKDFLSFIVDRLKNWTRCQCVGIRVINKEGTMPYEAYEGFSQEFWEHENWLSVKDHQCGCIRVASGSPDPLDKHILTAGGSLWTNDLQEFGKTIPENLYHRYRGKCIESGFASLAVMPIRHNDKVIGLIHLADTHENMLPEDLIWAIESVSPVIGEVMIRFSIEDALRAKEEFSAKLIESMFDGFSVLDANGFHIDVNAAFCKMTGFSKQELVGVGPPHPYWPKECAETIKAKFDEMREGVQRPMQMQFMRKTGEKFHVLVSPSFLKNVEGEILYYLATVKDVSELEFTRKKLAEKVEQLDIAQIENTRLIQQLEVERDLAQSSSLTDSLTGLPNRRFFDNALRAEFSRHKRSGSNLALIMLDVDHFKKYNDHYGHLQGDDCLREIANTLKTVVDRDADTVARYGGEEFIVILPDTTDEGAVALAERIGTAVRELAIPHIKSDVSECVTISLGVASASVDGEGIESHLVTLADQALYYAKNKGRNRCEIWSAVEHNQN